MKFIKYLSIILWVLALVFGVQSVFASTTIGTNISTGGNLTAGGALQFTNGAVNNYIFKTDASGNASWISILDALQNAGINIGSYLSTTSVASTYQTKLTNPITGTGSINQLAIFNGISGLTSLATGTAGQFLRVSLTSPTGLEWANVSSGGGAWGTITGTLSAQTDLQNALDLKLSVTSASSTYATISSIGAENGIAPLDSSNLVPLSNLPVGFPGGIATLDNTGKVPIDQLPTFLASATNFKGTWNANSNTPTLSPTSNVAGDYYTVSDAGSTDLACTQSCSSWGVGDWAVFNGTAWGRVPNTGGVTSTFGRTGAIVATPGDYSKSDVGLGSVSNNLQLTTANNLSDLTSTSSARTNIGFTEGTGIKISDSGTIGFATTSISQFANDAGYITSSQDVSMYLSTSTAASTYLTIIGASSTYLTTAGASSIYYPLSNPSSYITASELSLYLSTTSADSIYLSTSTAASTYLSIIGASSTYLSIANASSTYYPISNPSSYITTSALGGYLSTSTAASTYLTISDASSTYYKSNNPNGYLSLSGLSAANPITYSSTTGAIGWTNSNNYITLNSLSASDPITYSTSTGAIGWTNSNNYISSIAGQDLSLANNSTSSFITASALSAYLSTTSAASTYLTLSASTSLSYISLSASTSLAYVKTESDPLFEAASTSLPYIPSASSTLFLTTTSTSTLTNKTITPRVNTITSSATPAINTDTTDMFTITALATPITSMSSGLLGNPVNGQKLIVRILDAGVAETINWGTSFGSISPIPTTTVAGKYLYVGLIYNGADSLWECVASSQQ